MPNNDVFKALQSRLKEERLSQINAAAPARSYFQKYVKENDHKKSMAELESCIAHMVEEIASLKKIASELRLPSVLAMPIQRSVNIPVTIDQGGTGGTTASAARTALGIGTDDNTVNIGDPNTNGSWRFTISGANLLVQKREAGSWVEKGQFQP